MTEFKKELEQIQSKNAENSIDSQKPWLRKQLSWEESNQQIELENDDEEIDYMEYCKTANDKQITINNLRDETNKKELKS